jgi:signal transduction histidine kinase/CheY-like chemotaxis protein
VGLEPRGGAITLDDFYATVHPDDRVAFAEMLARQLAARTPYEFMYRTRHPDGTVRHLCGRGEPVLADDGTLVRLVGTAHDLTEQVELEAQLRQAQKMEAVGRLAGGVAHDFNNLLMVIGSHARFALDALPPASPVREEIEAIDEASRRAATLTRQLLAFSRKQILKPEVLELNAVVRGLEPMLRRLIGEDITVHSQLAPRLDMVLADPAQLEQVLVNLALNARDAMSAGGRLTIETANVDVCPTGAVAGPQPGDEPLPAGPYVRLTVRDTGAGMSAETQARAFEPFFTTKETGKGTGLGLATVYGIVRQSGGAVRVASAPGEGTTFEIDLPRAAACPANGSDGADAAVAGAGTETVMLVEDEPQVRAIVRRLLARRGYTVLEAADGHEALRIAADAAAPTIDLVVTDMVMPEMSGRDFADRLAVRRPGVRVLFMSGYTDDEIIRRGLLRPGMAFLEKPFSSDRLLAAVRAALELHA